MRYMELVRVREEFSSCINSIISSNYQKEEIHNIKLVYLEKLEDKSSNLYTIFGSHKATGFLIAQLREQSDMNDDKTRVFSVNVVELISNNLDMVNHLAFLRNLLELARQNEADKIEIYIENRNDWLIPHLLKSHFVCSEISLEKLFKTEKELKQTFPLIKSSFDDSVSIFLAFRKEAEVRYKRLNNMREIEEFLSNGWFAFALNVSFDTWGLDANDLIDASNKKLVWDGISRIFQLP